MPKRYVWYNNGARNKKVWDGQDPPYGYEEGYIIRRGMDYYKRVYRREHGKLEERERKFRAKLKKDREDLDLKLKELQDRLRLI